MTTGLAVPQTVDDWTALVRERVPFTYANVGGDGEMLTVTGWDGTNSDGIESTPDKAEALARCILEPRYTFAGYNPGRDGSEKLERAEAWLREQGVNVPIKSPSFLDDPEYGRSRINVRWVHKEILSSANVRGQLNGFLSALRNRYVTIVGGEHLEDARLWDALNVRAGVLIPRERGWGDMDAIEGEVRRMIESAPPDALVTWSLGYLTKVLMWRLAPDYPDVTQIDVGAMWDPYAGVRNRHGYRRDTWPAAMRANLEGLA